MWRRMAARAVVINVFEVKVISHTRYLSSGRGVMLVMTEDVFVHRA